MGVITTKLRIPMRGYEDLCGETVAVDTLMLRIPMRGYESLIMRIAWHDKRVTNPHAGL